MIIALDLSTKSTGYSVFDENTKELKSYNTLTASSTDLIKRIDKIVAELREIIKATPNLTTLVLEEVLPDKNFLNLKTHKALMYLQAAVNFLIHEINPKIKIVQYQPSEWRRKIGVQQGKLKRKELKQQDIQKANELFNLKLKETEDDAADSILIGAAYLQEEQMIKWE